MLPTETARGGKNPCGSQAEPKRSRPRLVLGVVAYVHKSDSSGTANAAGW